MNPTLVKVTRPSGTAPLPDEVDRFTRSLLGSHEPPFRRSTNSAGTSYVRVIHDSNELETLLSDAAPLVSASAVVLTLNGRTWKPPSADTSSEVSSDLRDPGSASSTLGVTSDLPLPRTPTPASKSPDITEIVVSSPPPSDDGGFGYPHEDRIRSVFPGTGGDDGFSPRPQQVQALSHIIQAIEGGATDIFLQMPTGGGKSVIGHALSKIVSASPTYFTVDKVALGDQYSRSLPVVHRIAGRRNYACHLDIEPSDVSRATAEVAEALARERARQADEDGDPDPFEAVRRRPTLTADAAPCRTVRVSTKDGDRGYPCSFSKVPAELNDWECPDCGSEEILHHCGPVGRWVDIGDHWAGVGPLLGSSRMCPYYRDRFIASNSASVITTNDYYFRYPQFTKRPLAVYDECDRLPNAVLRNLTLDLTTRSVARMLDVSLQSFVGARGSQPEGAPAGQRTLFGASADPNSPDVFDVPADLADFDPDHHLESDTAWEIDSGRIVGWLEALVGRVADMLRRDAYEPSTRARVETQMNSIRSFLDRIAAPGGVVATDPNYYWEAGIREDGIRYISLKPILVGAYAREILDSRSRIRLYMSATVGDVRTLVHELGLDPSATTYVRFDYSDFPVANRPIVAVRGGTMSYKRGEGRQPDDFLAHAKIIHGIATRMYPDRKGLILPFSNPIADGLSEAIRSRYASVSKRLIRDSSDMGSERYAFIERFRESTGNRVLLSTYTNEGFDPVPTDVDPDRSVHWLVVAKIPYPDLSDMRVRILRTRHPETYGDAWYEAETARTWMQMIGRIHRSSGDTGRIFVLDPAFPWAYKKWRHAGLVPRYIDEAVDLRD